MLMMNSHPRPVCTLTKVVKFIKIALGGQGEMLCIFFLGPAGPGQKIKSKKWQKQDSASNGPIVKEAQIPKEMRRGQK